jgi:ubiquinone/menaquinone biosynthesis C-methylase UbiE
MKNLKYYQDLYESIKKEKVDIKPFYNHGFSNLDGSNLIRLNWKDRDWKNQFFLYAHLFEELKENFENKNILEVGCGLGRGSSFIKNRYKFSKLYAIDNCPESIKYAKENYKDVDYYEMCATDIKFEKNFFDFIFSIESVHDYRCILNFYDRIYEVLKPNGYIMISDIFGGDECLHTRSEKYFEERMESVGFTLLYKKDITKNVQKSCNINKVEFKKKFKNTSDKFLSTFIDIFEYKEYLYAKGVDKFISYIYQKQ